MPETQGQEEMMKWKWIKTEEELPPFNYLLVGKWVDNQDEEFDTYKLCFYTKDMDNDDPPLWESYEREEPLDDPPDEWAKVKR